MSAELGAAVTHLAMADAEEVRKSCVHTHGHPFLRRHFVANELEATNGTDRYSFNAVISQQDLVDSYLPSFQACVEEGGV